MTENITAPDSGTSAGRMARALWWASVLLSAAGLVMSVLSGAIVADDLIVILYLATGALGVAVALRVPGNAVGWLLITTGAVTGLQTMATGIGDIVLLDGRGPEALGVTAAMFAVAAWPVVTFLPLIPVLLLFPNGTLPSPRWRIVLWLSVVGILGTAAGLFVLDDPDGEASRWGVANPYAIDPSVADRLLTVTFLLVILTLLAAASSLLLRLRRSRGAERQRIKWVVYGGVVAIPLWLIGGGLLDQTTVGGILTGLALTLIPVSIGMAILRYRLYDIDRLISRTVSYALVAGLLAAVFASITIGIPQVLPVSLESPLLVAGATLVAAALFNPLRRQVQARVDRRFNRSRYDAQQEIDGLSEILRSSVGIDDVREEVVGLVTRTMQPTTISMWIDDAPRP